MCENKVPGELSTWSTVALLDRVGSGDNRALEVLRARYLPRLRRWAMDRLPPGSYDATKTDEAVQEVLEETLKRPPSSDLEHGGAFLGYARRTLRTRLPEVTQRLVCDLPDGRQGDASPSPIEEAIGREKLEKYEAAFQRLELPDQAAIAGRLEAGMAYEEIAEELGMPDAPAARAAVGRALLRLAREIKNLGSSAGEST